MVKWVGKIILLGVLLVLSGCAAISEPDYAVNSNGDEDAALSAMDQNYLLSYERVVENALPVMDTDNTVGARLMAASLKLSIDDEIEKIKNSASLVVINNLNVSKAVADWFIQNEIRVYQYRCSVTGNELNKIYNTLCVLDKKYICKDIYFADSLPGKNSLGLDTVGFGGSEAILLKIGIYDNWTIAHENGHYIDFGVIGDLSAGFKDISWEETGLPGRIGALSARTRIPARRKISPIQSLSLPWGTKSLKILETCWMQSGIRRLIRNMSGSRIMYLKKHLTEMNHR